jgi:outer membrane protein TolC
MMRRPTTARLVAWRGHGIPLRAGALVLAATLLAGPARAAEPLRLSLREAVRLALDQGTATRLAALAVDEARSQGDQARSALFPQADAGMGQSSLMQNLKTVGFSAPGIPTIVGPFGVFDARVRAALDVLDLAALRRYQAARRSLAASELERTRTENDVAAAVATLYVAGLRATAAERQAEANVELFRRLRDTAHDQLRAGVATRIDSTRAEVQLARERQALLVARNQRQTTELALLRAIGADLSGSLQLTDSLAEVGRVPPTLEEALARARRERPERGSLAAQLQAAQLNRAAERAARLPTLGLQFQEDYSGESAGNSEWTRNLSAFVSVPIFTGGRLEARAAEAQVREQRLEAQQRELDRQIEEEVRRALLAYQNAHARTAVAEEAARLAADELELARDRFGEGVAPSIELDNAQTSYVTAREAHIAALADEAQAWYDLARATGAIRDLIGP